MVYAIFCRENSRTCNILIVIYNRISLLKLLSNWYSARKFSCIHLRISRTFLVKKFMITVFNYFLCFVYPVENNIFNFHIIADIYDMCLNLIATESFKLSLVFLIKI